jgi:hypothetical protein
MLEKEEKLFFYPSSSHKKTRLMSEKNKKQSEGNIRRAETTSKEIWSLQRQRV